MSRTKTKVFLISLCIALLVMYLILQVVLDADLIDDAYIFLRYAANFANGSGLVFNPGEYVEGYSSPLWQFCLGIFAVLHMDLEAVSRVAGAGLGAMTLLFLVLYGRKYFSKENAFLILLPACFLVTNTAFDYWVWSGMDTALFTFLFLLTFILFLRQVATEGSMAGSGICFMLATLTRLEMVVLAPVYLLFILYANRRQKNLLLHKYFSFLIPQLLLLVLILWRYSYYGSLLPNTFYAKVGIPFSILFNRGLSYSWNFASAYWLQILLPTVALIMILQVRVRAIPLPWKLASAIIIVWTCFVTVIGGDHFPEFRFYVPILPIIALIATGSLERLLELFSKAKMERGGRLIQDIALTATLLLGIFALNYSAYDFNYEGPTMRADVGLTRNWVEVGSWLKRSVPGNSTIASVVIGAIPYYSGLRTLDLLGLTDKEIATNGKVSPYAEIGHQKYETDYVLSLKPDYVIYNSSGQYSEPIYTDPHKITTRYAYALYDLALDERTAKLYTYKAIRMDNGKIIEFLQLTSPGH